MKIDIKKIEAPRPHSYPPPLLIYGLCGTRSALRDLLPLKWIMGIAAAVCRAAGTHRENSSFSQETSICCFGSAQTVHLPDKTDKTPFPLEGRGEHWTVPPAPKSCKVEFEPPPPHTHTMLSWRHNFSHCSSVCLTWLEPCPHIQIEEHCDRRLRSAGGSWLNSSRHN